MNPKQTKKTEFYTCFDAVSFQPKQNARAVKRLSCFSQSQSLSGVCAPSQRIGAKRWRWRGAQTADEMTCAWRYRSVYAFVRAKWSDSTIEGLITAAN